VRRATELIGQCVVNSLLVAAEPWVFGLEHLQLGETPAWKRATGIAQAEPKEPTEFLANAQRLMESCRFEGKDWATCSLRSRKGNQVLVPGPARIGHGPWRSGATRWD